MKKEQVRELALSLLDDKCGVSVGAYSLLSLLLEDHKIYDIQSMTQRQVFHVPELDLDEDRFVIETEDESDDEDEEDFYDDDEEEDDYCDPDDDDDDEEEDYEDDE